MVKGGEAGYTAVRYGTVQYSTTDEPFAATRGETSYSIDYGCVLHFGYLSDNFALSYHHHAPQQLRAGC